MSRIIAEVGDAISPIGIGNMQVHIAFAEGGVGGEEYARREGRSLPDRHAWIESPSVGTGEIVLSPAVDSDGRTTLWVVTGMTDEVRTIQNPVRTQRKVSVRYLHILPSANGSQRKYLPVSTI